ncbi:hypothetical protein AQUCO_01400574v1 [Aquilegia coerulea]|uniref:FLZ-type domain-containing protein n=1 Tax=Aquilegia coerulea TaxID=218851 RepID=A0A2G5DX44_AQUCA|nr:hypothetical protein AQUCO_01400574v1 [Aquilegia coerulea]
MLLGKRPRPHIRRTTSITEFTVDLGYLEDLQNPSSSIDQQNQVGFMNKPQSSSPRNNRRNSADFVETPHFLRACGLCNRRLAPGRDIFMYRGDTAFCSLECRQQQMNQDERKEKCSFLSKKEASISSTTVGSETSSHQQGGTVAAA